MFFVIVTKLQELFAGFTVPLPALTRAVLAIGPGGWLCLAVILGTLTILKDLKSRSHWTNLAFTALLALLVGCVTAAMFLPVIQSTSWQIRA